MFSFEEVILGGILRGVIGEKQNVMIKVNFFILPFCITFCEKK
jgi:hypothetical protein